MREGRHFIERYGNKKGAFGTWQTVALGQQPASDLIEGRDCFSLVLEGKGLGKTFKGTSIQSLKLGSKQGRDIPILAVRPVIWSEELI